MKHHSKKFDEFVEWQEVFKIAWENVPSAVTSPAKNTSKLIYTVGSSINSDYWTLLKTWKLAD